VVTLYLTINKPAETHLYETVCDTYPWYGMDLTISGTYYHTLETVNECDSTLVLHLTVNKSYAVDTMAIACDVFEWYGQICDTTGVYTYNGTTAAGAIALLLYT
jgi:hypothetical protein